MRERLVEWAARLLRVSLACRVTGLGPGAAVYMKKCRIDGPGWVELDTRSFQQGYVQFVDVEPRESPREPLRGVSN